MVVFGERTGTMVLQRNPIGLGLVLLMFVIASECNEFLRVCYFTSWSVHRKSHYAKFDVADIDPSLCTHLIYAFGKIDVESKLLVPFEPLVEDARPGHIGKYGQFNKLKQQNPRLKTLLSVGGQFDDGSGFVTVTENDIIIKRFAQNAVEFLRKRSFDGFDIDWEYPTKETKRTFIRLLRALREAIDADTRSPRLLLTVSLAAGKWYIDDGYDVPGIARYVDYANLMTYDYHGHNSQVAAFNSPLYSRKDPTFNPTLSTNWTVHYYNRLGLPLSKILVGVTPMGRQFILVNTNDTFVGAPVTFEEEPGNFYDMEGRLAYPEVCQMRFGVRTKKDFDIEQSVPFMWHGHHWVGYEDTHSAKIKVDYMLKTGAAGFMFWSLDQDDFTGLACEVGKYPLLKAMVNSVKKSEEPVLTEHVNDEINYLTQGARPTSTSLSFQVVIVLSVIAKTLMFL